MAALAQPDQAAQLGMQPTAPHAIMSVAAAEAGR